MELAVRRASISDLDVFLELYYEFYSELRNKQGWRPHSVEEYRRDAENILRRDTVFLAYVDGEPAGFIRVSERDGSYWIEELYVKPVYRGRGIGRKLVEVAEEYVSRHDSAVYVMVLPQDRRAIEFWLHMGYNILNTIELMKDLEPSSKDETRVLEFFGYRVNIWRWRKEEYNEIEKEFLEVVREFYGKGGSREEFLKVVAKALREWVDNVER